MSAGPQRGGMAARGAHASAPRPPPPHASPAYGYTPASFDNAPYNAANAYDPSGAPPSSYPGPPPPTSRLTDSRRKATSKTTMARPMVRPTGGFDGPNYGAPPMHGQFRPGPSHPAHTAVLALPCLPLAATLASAAVVAAVVVAAVAVSVEEAAEEASSKMKSPAARSLSAASSSRSIPSSLSASSKSSARSRPSSTWSTSAVSPRHLLRPPIGARRHARHEGRSFGRPSDQHPLLASPRGGQGAAMRSRQEPGNPLFRFEERSAGSHR